MTLWLRVRRLRLMIVVLAGITAVLLTVGSVSIPMPGLMSAHGLLVPIALLAPLALSTVLAFCLTAGDELLESVSSRAIRSLDTGLIYAATFAMLVVGVVLDVAGLSEYGAAAGRDACGYVGLMLLGRRIAGGQAASLFPAGLALATAAFGGDPSGRPRWWAWPLADATDERSWLLAIGLFVIAAAFLTRGRGIELTAG